MKISKVWALLYSSRILHGVLSNHQYPVPTHPYTHSTKSTAAHSCVNITSQKWPGNLTRHLPSLGKYICGQDLYTFHWIYVSHGIYELYCRPTPEGSCLALTLDSVYTIIVLESFNCSYLSSLFFWRLVALALLCGDKKNMIPILSFKMEGWWWWGRITCRHSIAAVTVIWWMMHSYFRLFAEKLYVVFVTALNKTAIIFFPLSFCLTLHVITKMFFRHTVKTKKIWCFCSVLTKGTVDVKPHSG